MNIYFPEIKACKNHFYVDLWGKVVLNGLNRFKRFYPMGVLGKNVFVGEFLHQMDVKNRLCIPSKWRFVGDNDDVYLALPNPIGCITIYPPKMIERLEEKVSQVSLGDIQGQKVLAKLFSQADTFGCDKQGRITLSEKLIHHAKLEKNALLVGGYATFNIWAPETYKNYMNVSEVEENEMSKLLQHLGL